MVRAFRIALLARCYRLIARRPEFLSPERERRLAHALMHEAPGPLGLLDAALVANMTEVDRLCGYAVSLLESYRGERASRLLLDCLGVLDPDRICAMYYALSRESRRVIELDPAWSYHVQRVRREMEDSGAFAWLEDPAFEEPMSETARLLARVAWG